MEDKVVVQLVLFEKPVKDCAPLRREASGGPWCGVLVVKDGYFVL